MRYAAPCLLVLAGGCADQVIGRFGAAAETAAETALATSASGGESTGGMASTGPAETGVASPEVCDAVDNDLDGLVDEVGSARKCEDCDLLQGVGQAWWVCEEMLDWQAAMDRCAGFGATLAVLPNAESQAFMEEKVGTGWFWLGARQADDEGEWRWADGSPLDYDNWGGTQPDDTAPGQDCLRLTFGITDGEGWFDGAWDDFGCEMPHRVLCSAVHGAE